MKRNIILLELGLFLMSISLFSQTYLINSDYCIVSDNIYLIVNGHVNNQSSGNLLLTGTNSNVIVQNNITNNGAINSCGIIELYGDWINNSTYAHNNTSYVYLKGGNQNVGGSATTTFYNLYLEGTGVKTLGNNEFVDGTLNLQDRELATQNYTMTVNNSAVGAIQRTTGFVSSTVGGGLARATNSASAYLFPVGVSGKYRPAEITPSGTTDAEYKVRMANVDASSEGYNRNIKATDICEVNPSFFYMMQQTSGTNNNANIKVYYDNTIDGSWDKVGNWNGSLWNNYTGSSTSSGSPLYYGSANNVSLSSSTPIALTKNAPALSIIASSDTICSGQSTVLTATGANTYGWSTGDNTDSITVTPSSTTTYTVTGTSNTGCSATASITITVISFADVTINPVGNLCDNQSSIILTAATPGGIWSGPGITNSSTGEFSPANVGSGTYTVIYVLSEQCGYIDTIDITVYPSPQATVHATDETCIDANDGTAWLEVTGGTPPYSYLWSPSSSTNDIITNLVPGEYHVTVTDNNNCSDKETIVIKPGTEDCYITHIYVPNVFSPDNFGNTDNEYLKIYGKGIETIDFSIFDRWGNKVFHTTDINEGWDGTYKGEPALVGDYTYLLKVNFLNGKREILNGHILLIR